MDRRPALTPAPFVDPDALVQFLDALRGVGYNISTEQYMAAQDLVLALAAQGAGAGDRQRLKRMLGPLICSTPGEQDDFGAYFDRWADRLLPARAGDASAPDGEEARAPVPPPAPDLATELDAIGRTSRRFLTVVRPLAFLAAIALLLLFVVRRPRTAVVQLHSTPDRAVVRCTRTDPSSNPVAAPDSSGGALCAGAGDSVGVTPLTLQLPPGRYDFQLALPDHRDTAVTVALQPRASVDQDVALSPLGSGGLWVRTTPGGATVVLDEDSTRRQTTPMDARGWARWEGVREGAHQLRVRLAGYRDVVLDTAVVAGRTDSVEIPLVRARRGSLGVRSLPSGARVVLNGVPRGRTPIELPDILEGGYRLVVSSPGYQDAQRDVSLEGDTTVELRLRRLVPLRVVSDPPGATVIVEGDSIGVTPVDATVVDGDSTIVVTRAGYEDFVTKRRAPDTVTAVLVPLSRRRQRIAFLPPGEPDYGVLIAGRPGQRLVIQNRREGDSLQLYRAAAVVGRVAAGISALAATPDGQALIMGAGDGSGRSWRPSTGVRTLAPLLPGGVAVQDLRVAEFGRGASVLAVAGVDGSLRVWRLIDGQPSGASAPMAIGPVNSIGINSSVPGVVATANRDGSVGVAFSDGREDRIQLLRGHSGNVLSVAVAPGLIASGGADGTVRSWTFEDRKGPSSDSRVIGSPSPGSDNAIHSVALSPDGRMLAAGAADGSIRLFVPGTSDELPTSPLRQRSAVIRLAFSPDGRYLAAAGVEREIWLWDLSTDTALATPLRGHTGDVTGLVFSPDGRTLASAASDGSLILWDVIPPAPATDDSTTVVASSPNRSQARSAARQWPIPDPRLLSLTQDTAYSADGYQVAIAGIGRHVILRDLRDSTFTDSLEEQDDRVSSVAFSPDGRLMAAGDAQGGLRLWAAQPQPVHEYVLFPDRWLDRLRRIVLRQPRPVDFSAIVTDSGVVILKSPAGTPATDTTLRIPDFQFARREGISLVDTSRVGDALVVRDIRWPERVVALPHDAPIAFFAPSADGRQVVTVSAGVVRVWNTNGYTELADLQAHQGEVYALAFSPDGRRLASVGADRATVLWDARTYSRTDSITLPAGTSGPGSDSAWNDVEGVAFSPGGVQLATVSRAGAVRLYEAPVRRWRSLFRLVPLLGALLALVIPWLVYRLYLRRRATAFVRRQVESGEQPHLERLSLPSVGATLYPSRQIQRISTQLRRRIELPSPELDVGRTVTATLRHGGVFTPAFQRRQVSPEYLALVDRTTLADQQAALIDELLTALRGDGVFITRYYFDGDPRICLPADPRGKPLSLSALAQLHPDHRLLIFGDARRFFHPITGALEDWTDDLRHWPTRALLTPEPPQRWGRSEDVLSQQLTVQHASASGIAAAVAGDAGGAGGGTPGARGGDDSPGGTRQAAPSAQYPPLLQQRPARWIERAPPAASEVDQMLRQLQHYLDDPGMLWLAACAVYPALGWKLTLNLGQELVATDGERLLQADRLLRLSRLPWFRYGYIPDWLRLRLLAFLSPGQEQQVRHTLERLLLTAVVGGDGAADLEIAQRHTQTIHDLVRPILRALRRRSSSSSDAVRDYVFAEFMRGRSRERLTVRVSRMLPALGRARADGTARRRWPAVVLVWLALNVFVMVAANYNLYGSIREGVSTALMRIPPTPIAIDTGTVRMLPVSTRAYPAFPANVREVVSGPMSRCFWLSNVTGQWEEWGAAATREQCIQLDSCGEGGGGQSGGGCYKWAKGADAADEPRGAANGGDLDAERSYRDLLALAVSAVDNRSLAATIPSARGVINVPADVAAPFTAGGWAVVQDAFRNPDRILGPAGAAGDVGTAGQAQERQRIIAEMRARYSQDYIASWRTYVRSIQISRPLSARDAAVQLGVIARPQSPLLGVLAWVSRNTGVDATVAAAFQPVHVVVPSTASGTYVHEGNRAYMAALLMLQSGVESISNMPPVTDTATAMALVQQAQQALTQATAARVEARKLAQDFAVDAAAQQLGPTIAALLEAPISGAERVLRALAQTGPPIRYSGQARQSEQDVVAAAPRSEADAYNTPAPAADRARILNERGRALCEVISPMLQKFPFNPAAADEATVAEVTSALNPRTGALATFQREQLSDLLAQQGGRWVAKPGPVALSPAFVDFLNRATSASRVLFAGSDTPRLQFSATGVTSSQTPLITLTQGTQRARFSMTEARPVQLSWPSVSGTGATLRAQAGRYDVREVAAASGEWAIFRLVAMSSSYVEQGILHATWTTPVATPVQNAAATTVTIRFTTSGGAPSVLQRGGLAGMTCVAQVAR